MNFRELSKEKKQYIFLGVVVGLTSLFVLFNAAFLPMKEKWANTKAECQMLQNDLDQAHRMIKNERTLRANLAESSEVLQKAAGEFLPSMENRLSWATQKMYANSRIVGVEISSVSEVEGAAVLQAQTKDGHRVFGSYSVRIITECSYNELKNLVEVLKEGNPYLSITGLTVDSRLDKPEQHSVNMVIEWPICLNTVAAERLAEQKEADHG